MGEKYVKQIESIEQKKEFVRHLLNDVRALDWMLTNDVFEKNIQRIGAEQEFCIVNNDFRPSLLGPEILDAINDPHFTTELARYNLEINLNPYELSGECFSKMENQLHTLLDKANTTARRFNTKIVLTGILPTINKSELIFDYMTPNPRYHILSKMMRNARGEDFELNIYGVDELIIRHETILFEACNTSFQIHLQIEPKEYVAQYNWSQAIAGPILSVATNSPLLLGNELWSETRIALFQQSIDMRKTLYQLRETPPRVTFGNEWIYNSVSDIFKNDISNYPLLLTTDIEGNSYKAAQQGEAPKLRALMLHNGTIYRWNRPCYGIDSKGVPHLRIENRYIPAGPSVVDEIANMLLWVGVMKGMPDKYKEIWHYMNFADAKGNFIRAARTGIETELNWFGKTISAKKLIKEEFIPMAIEGLKKVAINQADIDKYMNVIAQRIDKGYTGSKWMINSFRKLKKSFSREESLVLLTAAIHKRQMNNNPLHSWQDLELTEKYAIEHKYDKAYRVMSTDFITVVEDDLVEMVSSIMQWKQLEYLPVENHQGELVGLVSRELINQHAQEHGLESPATVKEIMETNMIVLEPEASVEKAFKMMKNQKIGCIPVVKDQRLIGIILEKELNKIVEKLI